MKKKLIGWFSCFFLLLPLCASGQVAYMEEKAKVNKIKRSTQYLYGEGIAATVDEAMSLAEQSLKNAILAEMADNKELQDADRILISSIKKHSEKIQLKRGAMERVFLYVEKKNLYSSDKMVALDVVTSVEAVPDKTEDGGITQESEMPDDLYRTVPDRKPDANRSEVRKETVSSQIFVPVAKPLESTVSVDENAGILENILRLKDVDQLQTYMREQKEQHKLMWGNVRSTVNDKWYIIVLDGNRVKAVLDRADVGGRKNLLTGTREDVGRYDSEVKVWFIIYE